MRKALNKIRWLSMICTIALVTGCQHEPNKPITSENAGKTTEATAKPIPAPLPTSSPVSTAPTNQPVEEQQKESLSPYQGLNKIREIEKVKGGTYQGEWKEDEYTFHAEWSPNFQAVAYYKGTTEDGQAYIWKVGNDSPSPIKEAVIDRYFFTWSPDSEYLLLDTGTSRHRGGQIYQVANDRMSEPFSYISQFRFSPDSKRAAFSQLSGIISKEKYGMEDEETEDIWLYELSTGKQKKLLQADGPHWLCFGRKLPPNLL
ncbi:hypothetical protein POF51_05755 [Brevibacillus sp. AG]|uniref:hypothetical protein n=1 Tax=Brevibacillus sp. AG TaxID=3020891 RepID=UPI000AB93A4F|nr:hypothetical protein [Brevibacillus sp. AG]MDC0760189.1 hypothetical protein [Brevibacillus sp. AG]